MSFLASHPYSLRLASARWNLAKKPLPVCFLMRSFGSRCTNGISGREGQWEVSWEKNAACHLSPVVLWVRACDRKPSHLPLEALPPAQREAIPPGCPGRPGRQPLSALLRPAAWAPAFPEEMAVHVHVWYRWQVLKLGPASFESL